MKTIYVAAYHQSKFGKLGAMTTPEIVEKAIHGACDEIKAEARAICKRTVERTLYSRRAQRCRAGELDIDCLARRYAPGNASNDPNGLNKNWKKNVLYFLNHER